MRAVGRGVMPSNSAGQGHEAVLCDLAPGNIAFAQQRFASSRRRCAPGCARAQVADIRTLPYPDGQFAAVFCLGGPLSHLPVLLTASRPCANWCGWPHLAGWWC